jgi:integrase
MPNVRFFVQKGKVDKRGFADIKAFVTINYKNTAKVLAKVKPHHWNKLKQRVNPSRANEKYNKHEEINKMLDEFQKQAHEYFEQCWQKDIDVTPELVRDYFNGISYLQEPKKDFWEAWDQFIESGKSEKAASTTKGYQTTKRYYQEFEAATKYGITFDTINLVMHDKFKNYVFNTRNHNYNYMVTLARRLKSFLNWSHERGYYTGTIHNKFKSTEKPGTVITLTLEEFNTLYHYPFKNNSHIKARDIFCFGCLTGLRISDLQQLSRDHLYDGMIVTNMKKVKKQHPQRIPVLPKAQAILDKYQEQYFLLPKLSEQKLNKYIKEAGLEAGLTRPIKKLDYTKGTGREITTTLDKELHAHLTRKTFITLAFAANIDIETIKEISGIRGERTLRHYLTISNEVLKDQTKLLSEMMDR